MRPRRSRCMAAPMAAVGASAVGAAGQAAEPLLSTIWGMLAKATSNVFFFLGKTVIPTVGALINAGLTQMEEPWRPEEIWVIFVYFLLLRPVLWQTYLACQFLRKKETSPSNFDETFFGFMHQNLTVFGIALGVNYLADTLVSAITLTGGMTSPVIIALGKADVAVYAICFAYFLYKLQEYYLDELLDLIFGKDQVETGMQDLVHRFLEVFIMSGTVLAVCRSLGTPASVLAGIYSIMGVGVGFAGQSVLQNFFGGLMLVVMRPFQVGDCIEISNPARDGEPLVGKVMMIGYYQSILLDDNNSPTYVPNQWFVSVEIKNFSREMEYFKNYKRALKIVEKLPEEKLEKQIPDIQS